MNWDQIEGNWQQFKGKIRQAWGKLTDDDIARIKGKKDVLAGKLQECYGYSKEKAEEEIKKFTSKAKNSSSDIDEVPYDKEEKDI